MADQKITQLTADATPTSDDLVVLVNDPGGTPGNKKATLANLATALAAMSGLTSAFEAKSGAWTSYTPTLTQSGAVTKTVTRAKYVQIGKTVHVNVFLTVTGTGTANNPVNITLPVAGLVGADGNTIGAGRVYDASAGTVHRGVVVTISTTTVRIEGGANSAPDGLGQTATPFTAALASGDVVEFSVTYEAA